MKNYIQTKNKASLNQLMMGKSENTCFVAGTLVHTKDGLVPIEKLKVGDWVLSKPESGEGEQAYKRVTKTFEHWSNNLYLLAVRHEQYRSGVPGPSLTKPQQLDCPMGEWTQWLVTTAEHPFYNEDFTKDKLGNVKVRGWTYAAALEYGLKLQTINGSICVTHCASIVAFRNYWEQKHPNMAYARDKQANSNEMMIVIFRENDDIAVFDPFKTAFDQKIEDFDYTYDPDYQPDDEKYPSLSAKDISEFGIDLAHGQLVYNIEVEDFHTYYVGEKGVWVHNKSFTLEENGRS